MSILDTVAPTPDLRLPYDAGEYQFGDLRLPKNSPGPHPVIIMVHGGYWRARYDLQYTGHICAALTAKGIATWNIEYRRIGNTGGGWPGTFQDVGGAADYLTTLAPTYNLDLGRVVSMGHSAGGHLALWLASRELVKHPDLQQDNPLKLIGAVSLAGVIDLRLGWQMNLSNGVISEFLGGSPEQVPERYTAASPAELWPITVPQLLIHGTDDPPENVPIILSESYYQRATAAGYLVKFIKLAGADHFDVVNPKSRHWPAIEQATLELLG